MFDLISGRLDTAGVEPADAAAMVVDAVRDHRFWVLPNVAAYVPLLQDEIEESWGARPGVRLQVAGHAAHRLAGLGAGPRDLERPPGAQAARLLVADRRADDQRARAGANEEQTIGECLGVLLAQDYPNLEIVVLDDGSTDGTRAALAAIDDRRVRVMTGTPLPYDARKNWACHQLATAACGDVLCFVDADTLLEPETISRAAGEISDGKLGLCRCC